MEAARAGSTDGVEKKWPNAGYGNHAVRSKIHGTRIRDLTAN
jgi:hypothetical protein